MIAFTSGLKDACRLHEVFLALLLSKTVRHRVLSCVLMNAVIFIGSIFIFEYGVIPLMQSFIVDDSTVYFSDIVAFVFLNVYRIVWIYPIYCISFVLSTIWYQDIADHTFKFFCDRKHKNASTTRSASSALVWLRAMTQEIYRLFLITSFLIQVLCSSFIPIPAILSLIFTLNIALNTLLHADNIDLWR